MLYRGHRAGRPRSVRFRLAVEILEVRAVPSLTWTTLGEGSVVGNAVTMGVPGRAETGTQSVAFHGAYAVLPASRHYEIAFDYDLSTWDSYNADSGSGTGYWDSFTINITSTPYPQLNVLTDPLQFGPPTGFLWGGQSWTDHVLEHTSGQQVITADFNVSAPRYLNIVLDTKTTPTTDNRYPSWGTVKVITGDLAMVKSDGSDVPDNQQLTQGGYVALNNADADANGTLDKDQAGPIDGETDLVPLVLHPVDLVAEGGTYTLNDLSPNLKIWKDKKKADAVTNATTFDATQTTTVYVEGVGKSAGKAKEEIDLKWTNGTITATLDQVKYTVYVVNGPKDVPDYSIMPYTADVPGGGTPSWTATNGTIQGAANTTSAKILWGAGPAIGKATFSPAPGWSVDYEANIVQVKIEAPSAGNAFTAGTPFVDAAKSPTFIESGTPVTAPGNKWKAKVTLNGPSENGVDQRGVKHIEVGFVQTIAFPTIRGDYVVNGANVSLTGNVQGKDYHDADPGDVYYDTGATYVFKPTGTAAADRTKEMSGEDSPSAVVPLYYKQGGALNNPGDAILASMHWTDTFQLWITARTDETDNAADQIYTSRALANWSFTIDENYPFPNPLVGSSVTVPAAWTDVTDGSQPTHLHDATTANNALATLTFA